MDNIEFQRHRTVLNNLCEEIMGAKGPVYTQATGDRLRNFKLVAEMINGGTAGQVISVYLAKQFLSVTELLSNPSVQDTERETRFADLRNYLDLAYALYMEGSQHAGLSIRGSDDPHRGATA